MSARMLGSPKASARDAGNGTAARKTLLEAVNRNNRAFTDAIKTHPVGRQTTQVKASLQKFAEAKALLVDLLNSVECSCKDLERDVAEYAKRLDFIPSESSAEMQRFMESIVTMRDMLGRDHMKVAFFGRTSNGKSTAVNAMLGARRVPMGMGHTTACFVQVAGSENEERYFVCNDSDEHRPAHSIDDVADALKKEREQLGENTLVTLYLPHSDTRLLQHDIVIVDTPGVDVSAELDKWIDNHCLDADVFVFVANAEATLTQAERNFFLRVKEKVSRPNIFILNNRWDASASDLQEHMTPDEEASARRKIEQVRQQHMKEFQKFLVDELQVTTKEELKNRVFFVSAKEMLAERLRGGSDTGTPNKVYMAADWQKRAFEFARFEEEFETCISKSAIEKKHATHAERMKEICSRILNAVKKLRTATESALERTRGEVDVNTKALKQAQLDCQKVLTSSQKEISVLSQEVQIKVADDFRNEISQLSTLIDTFDKVQFDDDPATLREYKRALIEYIDAKLTRQLQERCTTGLKRNVTAVENNIINGCASFFADEHMTRVRNWMNLRGPFELHIACNVAHMAESFREDLNFHFTLGITNMYRWAMRTYLRATSKQRTEASLRYGEEVNASDDKLLNGFKWERLHGVRAWNNIIQLAATDQQLMTSLLVSGASVIANGSIGLVLVGGLIYRVLGSRPIVIGALVVGGFYAYERLRWNSYAKEKQLKRQLRHHLEVKLHDALYSTTAHCDQQVKQEMQSLLTQVRNAANEWHTALKRDVDTSQQKYNEIEAFANILDRHKGVFVYHNSRIERFEEDYFDKS